MDAWNARYDLYRSELASDQDLLRRTHSGSLVLADILKWKEIQHLTEQAKVAQTLVDRHMKETCPIVAIPKVDKMASAVASAIAGLRESTELSGALQSTFANQLS